MDKGKGKENINETDDDNNNNNNNNTDNSLITQEKKNLERPCLLPSSIASRITSMTTSSCLTIRTASSVVDTLYELAKAGTDASFDLSRNVLIRAIKIARSIHRDEENENPNSFIKALDACTDFGINVINNTFSATEIMTLTSFHLAQKGLRYTFKWAEEALNVLDSLFGKTETSREISALLYLVQSEIKNYVKNEKNVIKKGLRSINFIKAITAYACLQIMTYETILKKRKLTLLYEGNSYLESVPIKLIESEEDDFFSLMNNQNKMDDTNIDKNDNSNSSKSKDKSPKETRNETAQLLLSTLTLSKSSKNNDLKLKTDSPSHSDDDKKSFLEEALHNMNNYSPSFVSSISDKLDSDILSRASSQEISPLENNEKNIPEINIEKYIYPKQHFIKNISKFIKFASGVYGRHFMRVLDIGDMRTTTTVDTYLHPNDYAFSIHTNTPLENILYSSYSSKTTSTTNNIVHIISVDHDMKAIIVTLRGTLGFYDFIIDLEFDYANINFNGKDYHVHSGIYQSAKIISQPNSVIHNIVRVALNDYPDYGLVLCGHSLGGGVAAMLGLLWLNPDKPYVTSVESKLPPNRPLHVYSYGTPSCMQEELAIYCRSFVTSIVNHYDIIPRLSIGILTDLRNCADELLDEKNHGLAEEIFSRSLATFNKNNSGKELNWFWDKFLQLKKHMNTEKLVPPGIIYIIETADIPVMESSNYEINNLPEMPLYDECIESDDDTKRFNYTKNKNSAYVDMIIDSIHNLNTKDQIYNNRIKEEDELNSNMDTEIDQDIEMNEVNVASTSTDKGKKVDKNEKEITVDADAYTDYENSEDDIIELNVTNENKKKSIEKLKALHNNDNNDSLYYNSMLINQQQGFEDNKQGGRLYTSNHAKKSSKYYSRTPSTLPNKNMNMKRVILLRCDDVKEQFSELTFAKSMFFDHAPGNYENLLNALEKAVFKK